MLLAISPIVARQGVWAVILVAAYLASLTLVKLLVKRTITLGFPYPDSITALHMSAISWWPAHSNGHIERRPGWFYPFH